MNTQGKQLFQVGIYDSIDIYVTYLIDFDHPKCEETIKQMSCFWSGHPDAEAPLSEHLEYWLKLATNFAYSLHQWEGWMGLSDTERLTEKLSREGGYFPLDGSYGIRIYDCYFEEYDEDDFEIKTLNICTCVACGCTDANTCTPSCHWIQLQRKIGIGLCSQCQGKYNLWFETLKSRVNGEKA